MPRCSYSAERLGKHVYGYDEETLMASIGRRLMALNKTLSLAESCTGGNIGKLITSIPAAVPISWEVVSYDNSVKEKVLGFQGNPGYSWSSE